MLEKERRHCFHGSTIAIRERIVTNCFSTVQIFQIDIWVLFSGAEDGYDAWAMLRGFEARKQKRYEEGATPERENVMQGEALRCVWFLLGAFIRNDSANSVTFSPFERYCPST